MNLRSLHRSIAIVALLFIAYLGVTGSLLQLVDLHTLLTHKPATDPEMLSIRSDIYGAKNFSIIDGPDYDAQPLPSGFNFTRATSAALTAAGPAAFADLRFLEFRMAGPTPVVILGYARKPHVFDAATGTALPTPPPLPLTGNDSLRQKIKLFHILRNIGNWMAWLHFLTALSMFVLIITGLTLYFRMLSARSRANLRNPFWTTGGLWRATHRWISITAAILLLWVAATGMMLSIDQLSIGIYQLRHHGETGPFARFPPGAVKDYSAPLDPAKFPAELATTLAAYQSAHPGPLKVLRIRSFAGMPQGILVAGLADNTTQLAFNAETGNRVSAAEPSYPRTQYLFGWEEHELIKRLHRGDYFGLPGRLLDLYAGLSMIYLSLSGLAMYLDRRHRSRLPALPS